MKDEVRPDPDQILETLKKRERKRRGGRLYLFLGMAPGVGKTYSMILAAQEAKKSGIEVVIGVVECHGRKETEALLIGLPIIPKKEIEYRGIVMAEMDLDAILARKPRMVLVDELAHTNVPGSRHAKRWQDVYEILDAGIDVFSTLNVQHLESRKEIVEQIAGITVRETVPDSVLDRAHQIRLIDLSPQDLLRRLREGKVYLGDRANLAAENFFKEDRLTALREISLRLVAEKVDYDLQSYSADRALEEAWPVTERLMAVISHETSSEALIRAARKLAFNLEAPWLAVYVDTGTRKSEEEQAAVIKNMDLARSLGADIFTVNDPDIASALARVALQKNVTQILIGRRSRKFFGFFGATSLFEKLLRQVDVDILVVGKATSEKGIRLSYLWEFLKPRSDVMAYVKACVFILALTLINYALVPVIGYRAAGFVFLLGTLIFGLLVSFGPVLFLASITALIWAVFFIPEFGKFKIHTTEDIFMVATYFVAALACGILTRRSQRHQEILAEREARTRILYEISQEISANITKEVMIGSVAKKIGKFLNAQCDVVLGRRDGSLKPLSTERLTLNKIDKETAVAQWAFDNQKPAGWSTDTLAGAEALYIPLRGSSENIGILAFKPYEKLRLSPQDQDLLFLIAKQLGLVLEKELFRERASETDRLLEMDKIHRTLLNLISDEVRYPLSVIVPGVKALAQRDASISPEKRKEISETLLDAIEELKFTLDNLLTMSRITIGIFPLQKTPIAVKTLIELSIESVSRFLRDHVVEIIEETETPLVNVDVALLQKVISNLLINAATYSPKNTYIEVRIARSLDSVLISIADQGFGLEPEELGRIFEKFYQISGKNQRGIGLGLAVAKGIIKAHGGKIAAANRPGSGAILTFSLPISPRQ